MRGIRSAGAVSTGEAAGLDKGYAAAGIDF
jgi:hypothetical protein